MMVGIEEAAADCLEEGCEIGTVESLLEQMKAEKNPSTKMLMTIKRLEVLIKSPEDNASDIEKLVSAAARQFSVVDTFNFPGEPIGYTGKDGARRRPPASRSSEAAAACCRRLVGRACSSTSFVRACACVQGLLSLQS